ncbi:MAG TPA: response regulator transcription factor [Bryobacteraceae bacterium]|jgi:DNA-binding NarL/FixJ family response regulator
MLAKKPFISGEDIRNCCRCGDEFKVDGNERVCPTCRKPKQPQVEQLTRHLTLREKQIVELVKQAKLNKEIAYILHLSEGTIKEYLNKIFRKLDVKNRTELAVWSLSHPTECRIPVPVESACMHDGVHLQHNEPATLQ